MQSDLERDRFSSAQPETTGVRGNRLWSDRVIPVQQDSTRNGNQGISLDSKEEQELRAAVKVGTQPVLIRLGGHPARGNKDRLQQEKRGRRPSQPCWINYRRPDLSEFHKSRNQFMLDRVGRKRECALLHQQLQVGAGHERVLFSETWNDHGLVEGGMTAEISVAPAVCRGRVGFLDSFEILEQGSARLDTLFLPVLAFMFVDLVFAYFCRSGKIICILFSFSRIWPTQLAQHHYCGGRLTGIQSRLWRSWSTAFSCGGRI